MSLERILADYGEALQYLVYFGLLAGLGVVEALAPRRDSPAERTRRWAANFGLTALNVIVLGALPVSGLAVAVIAQQHGWGLLHRFLPALHSHPRGRPARAEPRLVRGPRGHA